MILHDIVGHTLREVAAIEGISPSTASDRHQRGITLLRAAAADELGAVAAVPETLRALCGDGAGPSPELLDRAWRRARVELGALEGPPASGTWPAGAVTGALVAGLLAGRLAGPALDRCVDVPRGEPLVLASVESVPATEAAAVPAPAPCARPAASRATGRRDDERSSAARALLDRARAALALESFPDAVEALAEHARRFPRGQDTVVREQMWFEACARHRRAHAQGDAPAMGSRCAGR